jgi:hypothetical protein
MNLPICVIPGKIAFTDGKIEPRREIRINKESTTLPTNFFPLRIPKDITLIIGGDSYKTHLYRYEKSGCIGDAMQINGRYLRDFLRKHELGSERNETVRLDFISDNEIIVSKP